MSQKNYVVTGANRGIGLELVRQISQQGHKVIATARDVESASDLRSLSESKEIEICALDVSKDESVESFAQFCSQFDAVDTLICNAGVHLDKGRGFEELPASDLMDTFNINVAGNFRVTQKLLPLLQKSSDARCVQISSQMGSIKDNSSGGSYAYRSSKTALNMINQSLAVDFPQIICLTMHPGWVQTDMGGPNAKISTEESAKGLLNVIQNATRESSGGFWTYSGKQLPW